eukprot:CAMPEP_0172411850 /NCGR_PEP_ID=MMETSP1061-20121228/77600_1 /TAXON_ID=37318 /ORGANISM="Pseudo-nitzschia pungens, Strain cf. pungens" /LENGTH=533 /DNA_ID=CAMNT_0013148065 /DNA_START=197 /DNA_END=1795 /DNA_ORIENTATION=+
MKGDYAASSAETSSSAIPIRSTTTTTTAIRATGSLGSKDCGCGAVVAFFGLMIVLLLLWIGVMFVCKSRWCWWLLRGWSAYRFPTPAPFNNYSNSNNTDVVPFVLLGSGPTPIRERLRSVVEAYRREGTQALQGLSAMLEWALEAEGKLWNSGESQKENKQKLFSSRIRRRIERTAACLEHDEKVLEQLLGDFSPVAALPDRAIPCDEEEDEDSDGVDGYGNDPKETNHTRYRLPDRHPSLRNESSDFSPVAALPDRAISWEEEEDEDPDGVDGNGNGNGNDPKETNHTRYRLPDRHPSLRNESSSSSSSETHSYESATQILAHLVRDWTAEGRPIRNAIYDWCCRQMESNCPASDAVDAAAAATTTTVLVPGAGMGRLAYDLSLMGYSVEANELSVSMAAAASAVLGNRFGQVGGNVGGGGGSFFHPFLLDSMANEVDSERRFESVAFPEVLLPFAGEGTSGWGLQRQRQPRGSLSYTVGDFVGTNNDVYYRHQRAGQFDAVVTCFFIDTATNIYEYVDTIHQLLKPRTGVW